MKPNPLALRRHLMPAEDIDFTEPPRAALGTAPSRAFLIGIGGGFGGGLRTMRVIMVMPGHGPGPALAAAPPRERLPLDFVQSGVPPAALRAITGAVLRDAHGRLFEQGGDAGLRPLGRVLAGTRGELYEQAPAAPPQPAFDAGDHTTAGTAPAVAAPAAPSAAPALRPPRRAPRRWRPEATPPQESPATAQPQPAMAAVRALLPAPGKWVQLPVGEFAPLLRGQFAHPGRLAADYEIGAWLQVFDCDAALDAAEAARQVFGDAAAASRFAPWSVALAQRLGVTLGASDGEAARAQAAPGRIAARQRFFALRIAADPTTGAAEPVLEEARGRSSVPARWQAALPPATSREQAVAGLQHALPRPWWQRWRGRVGSAARAAWQQQLAGRTLEEQLWAVPPPRHGLGDARVREWARRTLRLAGYDTERMADEWELFWRCRGALD